MYFKTTGRQLLRSSAVAEEPLAPTDASRLQQGATREISHYNATTIRYQKTTICNNAVRETSISSHVLASSVANKLFPFACTWEFWQQILLPDWLLHVRAYISRTYVNNSWPYKELCGCYWLRHVIHTTPCKAIRLGKRGGNSLLLPLHII